MRSSNKPAGNCAYKTTLVYKRTHKGDPDKRGLFGIRNCMRRVRSRDFYAVIGVGGKGTQAREAGINGKINWIGIGPRKELVAGSRNPLVAFDHFLLFEEKGQDLMSIAPCLAEHLYLRNGRVLMSFSEAEQEEINQILKMGKNAPPSMGRLRGKIRCASKHCQPCGRKQSAR